MLPVAVREGLTRHLADVRRLHERDLARGFGRVVLPFALAILLVAIYEIRRSSRESGWLRRLPGVLTKND